MGPEESESKTSRTRWSATSISSSVVIHPKLKRMEASLCVSVRPKARSTCDGSGMPDAQARGFYGEGAYEEMRQASKQMAARGRSVSPNPERTPPEHDYGPGR